MKYCYMLSAFLYLHYFIIYFFKYKIYDNKSFVINVNTITL